MAKLKEFGVLLGILIIMSCNKEKRTYYENGNLKLSVEINKSGKKNGEERLYYPTGRIKSISFYDEGKLRDSTITFNEDSSIKSIKIIGNKENFIKNFENGKMKSTGALDSKNRPIGWWKYFKSGNIEAEEERVIVLNKSFVNRVKIFKDKQIDSLKSRLYEVKYPGDIAVGKLYPFIVKYNFESEISSKNLLGNEYYYLLTSPQIEEDFSNVNKIILDTIYPSKQNEFFLTVGYRNSGKKSFRAILEKHTMVKENGKLLLVKSQMFINERINVF